MGNPLKVAVGAAVGVGVTLLGAALWVTATWLSWGWFVEPLVGRSIGWWHALGLLMFLTAVRGPHVIPKVPQDLVATGWYTIIAPAFVMGVGASVKWLVR